MGACIPSSNSWLLLLTTSSRVGEDQQDRRFGAQNRAACLVSIEQLYYEIPQSHLYLDINWPSVQWTGIPLPPFLQTCRPPQSLTTCPLETACCRNGCYSYAYRDGQALLPRLTHARSQSCQWRTRSNHTARSLRRKRSTAAPNNPQYRRKHHQKTLALSRRSQHAHSVPGPPSLLS